MAYLILLATIGFQRSEAMEQVDLLRTSFKANRDAFAFGTFHFEYTTATCKGPADAEAEVFSKSITEDGLYAFDGTNARYDLLAEPAALAAVTIRLDKNRTSTFAMVVRMLTNGEATLFDRLFLDDSNNTFYRRPHIEAGTTTFCNGAYFQFPLLIGSCDKGGGDLYRDLSALKDGQYTLTSLDFDSELDGVKVCKLSYTTKGGNTTYWIDRNRGCLPVRIEERGDKPGFDSIYRFADFEPVAGAGWLPRRRHHAFGSGRRADRILVTKIDVTNRPARTMFQLEFPEPVEMPDRTKRVLYPKQKTWSLLDLPDPSSPGTKPFGGPGN